MSGFKVNFSVNNQLATPSIHASALANRPTAGQPGRVFIDTDNPSTGIYRDTGTIWVQIAETSDPEADTLQTVTDRGNTTTQDIAIGTSSTPSAPLDVHGADTIAILQGTGTNNAFLQFNKSGSGKFKTGNVHNGGNDYFTVYNMQENSDSILVNISTNNVAIGGGVVAPSYRLDVQGSFRTTGAAYLGTSGSNIGIGTTTPDTYLAGSAGMSIFRSGVVNGLSIANSSSSYVLQYINTSAQYVFYSGTSANRLATAFGSTGNWIFGTNTSDAGQKLQVAGTSRLAGDVTIITTTNSRQLTFENSTARSGVNIYQPNATLTFNNGGSFELYCNNLTFFTSAVTYFTAFQGTAQFIYRNASSVNAWATVPDATVPYAWGRKLCLTGGTTITVPNANAVLDIQSTTMGVKFPSMTTAEKNAIANTAGLVVFDTTLAKLCVNSGAGWETITSV